MRCPRVARASKNAAEAARLSGPSPFEVRGACHRAGHLGGTRWRAPQGDGIELQLAAEGVMLERGEEDNRQRRTGYAASAFNAALGWRSMIRSSARMAPSGLRRPCS